MRLHITLGCPPEGDPECLYSGGDGQKAVDVTKEQSASKYAKFLFIRNPTSIRKSNEIFKPQAPPAAVASEPEKEPEKEPDPPAEKPRRK